MTVPRAGADPPGRSWDRGPRGGPPERGSQEPRRPARRATGPSRGPYLSVARPLSARSTALSTGANIGVPRPSHHPVPCHAVGGFLTGSRSEEHTSELQSRENLVCRLLLKNKNYSVQA